MNYISILKNVLRLPGSEEHKPPAGAVPGLRSPLPERAFQARAEVSSDQFSGSRRSLLNGRKLLQVEKHLKQWSRLPQEAEPQPGGRPWRPGLPEGTGGFHLSQGRSLPRPDFWILAAIKPQETLGDASEGAQLLLKTVSGILT